jgi:putative ABC transport system permease protein
MRWWRRKKRDADLERELRSDLELEEEEHREHGLSPEKARYAARRSFGNATLIKEQTHEAWGWAPFERAWQDVQYAFRQLRRSPGFALITVFTLALGIGSTTAIFSIFNATLLRPLPFVVPDRLVILWWSSIPHLGFSGPGSLTDPDFSQWQQQNQVFEQIAAFRGQTSNLTDNGVPERLLGATVTASLFPLLGVAPERGRVFFAGEQKPGRENVVLISHKLWARRFASNPEILGKTIKLDGNNFVLLGVMPPSFQFPNQPDFWTPMVLTSDRSNATDQIIARLKPNVTLARAAEDAAILQHGNSPADRHEEIHLSFVFLRDIMGAKIRPTLNVLLAAVALLLLIACANVANLFLTRATARRHEISMRRALGASRMRIIRQLLTESTLLAGFAGVLGVALAAALGAALTGLLPQSGAGPGGLYQIVTAKLDIWVLGFSFCVALGTGILFGLTPAMSVSKSDLLPSVKESGGTHTGESGSCRLRRVLIVAEFALTFVLLIVAGLLVKSFVRLLDVNPGFEPHHVAVLNLELPETKYQTATQRIAFHEAVLSRMNSLPGIRDAGTVGFGLPFGDGGIQGDFTLFGQPQPPDSASKLAVSPKYFSALGIPLQGGRWFNDSDTSQSEPVIIVSQSFAQRFWPGKNAIGQRVNPGFSGTGWCVIVGVAGDVKQSGLASGAPLTLYLPYSQAPDFLKGFMSIVIRGDGQPLEMLHALRAEVQAVDPEIPIFDASSMEDLVSKSVSQPRLNSFLLAAFAAFALLLAAVGIYGVISYSVTQRQREIGVRVAIGATRRAVMVMMIREGVMLAFVGIVLGLGGGLLASHLVSAFLFQVTPTDPETFAGVSMLLGLVVLAACFFPAHRASRIDPMVALRCE